MPYSKRLQRLAETDARVSGYDFIGDDEEAPHWLYLCDGYSSPEDPGAGLHIINGRTVKEVLSHWPPDECECCDLCRAVHITTGAV